MIYNNYRMYSDKDYSLYNGIPKTFSSINDKVLDEWEIAPWDLLIQKDKLLGSGNFGKVYIAKWKHTTVVAKVMHENIPMDKKELIKREFNVLTKCHHPNVIQLLGYVSDPFIIVMEYLSNGELLNYINNNKFISKINKINICLDILRGLYYLHNRKPSYIIHRDIKPQNILITPSGSVKIADFGISKLFFKKNLTQNISQESLKEENKDLAKQLDEDNELTMDVGAPRYMAPEIKENKAYNFKIDIWSAGIIFAELFENKRYNDNFLWVNTPKRIKNIIINKMLNKEPNNRLSSNELIILFENELKNFSKFCFFY